MNINQLRAMQRSISERVRIEDAPQLSHIQYLGAFDIAIRDTTITCAAVVCKADTLEVIERKTLTMEAPMKYIPGYEAFREGVAMLQIFYELEYTPQLIFITGAGIAHPIKAGLASYLGVELETPTIGVAKKASFGTIKDDQIYVGDELRGTMVRTKDYANPLAVSPGHLISIPTAAEWVRKTIVPPHKKPEPLHIAGRIAKKTAERRMMSDDDE